MSGICIICFMGQGCLRSMFSFLSILHYCGRTGRKATMSDNLKDLRPASLFATLFSQTIRANQCICMQIAIHASKTSVNKDLQFSDRSRVLRK